MEKFLSLEGLVAPLDRENIDTDAIIPKQYLSSIRRTGFGQFLFDEWRYQDVGYWGMDCSRRPKNPAFVLNMPKCAGASILMTRGNFGCGSSREHAVWALLEYGFKVVIAPSVADIFYQNSLKNGLLPICLAGGEVDALFELAEHSPLRLSVDLLAQKVQTLDGRYAFQFQIDSFRKQCLLDGLDDVDLTLQQAVRIQAFEKEYHRCNPWLNGLLQSSYSN